MTNNIGPLNASENNPLLWRADESPREWVMSFIARPGKVPGGRHALVDSMTYHAIVAICWTTDDDNERAQRIARLLSLEI